MAQQIGKNVGLMIDNAAGTLTDITTYVTSTSLEGTQAVLDTTPYGKEEKTNFAGLAEAKIPIAGLLNTTTDAIFGPLIGNRTSITKTVQYYNGVKYRYGEANVSDSRCTGGPADLLTFSCNLTFSGVITSTSVTQA